MSELLYDLKALCAQAGVTPRTVHFYIQSGLLRPAGTPGPGSRYDDGHLARLRLIKLLQKEHLPLAEIRKRLESLDEAEVEAVLGEYRLRPTSSRPSAADYIRSVLAGETRQQLSRAAFVSEMTTLTSSPAVQRALDRSQWERIPLATDVELHVRRPLSREQNRRVERLKLFARELFEEEMLYDKRSS